MANVLNSDKQIAVIAALQELRANAAAESIEEA